MVSILLTILFTLIAADALWRYYFSPKLKNGLKSEKNALFIIFTVAAAFLLRVILGAVYKGHSSDMSCFTAWANVVFEHGFSRFYTLDMFHDYPPGYMYILYIVGALQKLFGLSGGAQYVLVKLPAIICDLLTGILVYKVAKNKFSDSVSTILAALYLFNPAAILNCSLWGQVDSVYTLLVLLMIYFITEKKMLASYFSFAVCIFIKPQAFIFTPVLIGGIIQNVFLNDFSSKKFIKNLIGGLCAIAALFIIALPFGISNVIEQYKATLASYPYLTVNAFNIWGAMGKNWTGLTTPATVISYIFLAGISVYSLIILIKSKNKSKFYKIGRAHV